MMNIDSCKIINEFPFTFTIISFTFTIIHNHLETHVVS